MKKHIFAVSERSACLSQVESTVCGGDWGEGYQSSLIVCSISKEQSLRRNRPLSFSCNKVRHAQGWVGRCGGGGANKGTELKATEDWEMEKCISSLSVQGGWGAGPERSGRWEMDPRL